MRVRLAAASVILALAACGGAETSPLIQIGFKRQALGCHVDGLMAKLQNDGMPGFCMLNVNTDDTVSGTCPAVPTGDVRVFRLVYFVMYPSPTPPPPMVEVDLAVAISQLDLTSVKSRAIVLDFTNTTLDTSGDDDHDGISNIQEICMGRNPLVPGS